VLQEKLRQSRISKGVEEVHGRKYFCLSTLSITCVTQFQVLPLLLPASSKILNLYLDILESQNITRKGSRQVYDAYYTQFHIAEYIEYSCLHRHSSGRVCVARFAVVWKGFVERASTMLATEMDKVTTLEKSNRKESLDTKGNYYQSP
jgi:hypothetical protein